MGGGVVVAAVGHWGGRWGGRWRGMSTKLALAVGETCFWGLQPKEEGDGR